MKDRMTLKSSILSDRQKAVIETIRMRLNEKQSLEYLKEVGFEMAPATYQREKRKVEELKLQRLYHIAKIGFQDQHLDRIDNTELCLKLMWENYQLEQDPSKRFEMLKDIILVQPYLSAYYEATKDIIQQPEYQKFLLDNNQQQEQQHEEEKQTKENGESFTKLDNYNKSSFTYDDKDDNRKFQFDQNNVSDMEIL